MSESAVLKAVTQYLDTVDVYYWRNNTGAHKIGRRFIRYGCPGSADILSVYRGKFIAIECKTNTGHQSPAQKSWQKTIEKHGGVYILARGIGDVRAYFEGLSGEGGTGRARSATYGGKTPNRCTYRGR